ncbi:hypothetical protein M406DRAFT_254696 [Cryphonectria parasitica EP155]|uniref:Carboxymuconolactone decarboxylase-like domain-containing protein n=1 Tax=Cryphonectria parasitica (strain ATCC 38755 / EP155) TaxID=660469 RepID=A0A9P4Y7Z0_CRYP1|nr:uncharacterized protein M406DRAFT_254696 [Cryphonectria parasitica EP155]KAF3768161.1 hypothetical protein M406DRAFT_254696 [Cryphonectria parasitica EP155]
MAPRFPLDRAPDPATRHTLETQMNMLHSGRLPVMAEDRSEMLGWCAPLSYAPDNVVRAFMDLSKVSFQPQHAKPRNRKLAVTAFISVTQIPYMRHCHLIIGEADLGFSADQLRDALAGTMPEGLNDEEQAAYNFGKLLATQRDPIKDQIWEEFAGKLQKSEIVGITNFVGVYQWLALLTQLNGEDDRWN